MLEIKDTFGHSKSTNQTYKLVQMIEKKIDLVIITQ